MVGVIRLDASGTHFMFGTHVCIVQQGVDPSPGHGRACLALHPVDIDVQADAVERVGGQAIGSLVNTFS